MSDARASKLFVEYQFPITHANVAIVLAAFGVREFEYMPAESGIENATLIVRTGKVKYVLRIYRLNKKITSEIELELRFAEFLSGNGIPTPKIIVTKAGHTVAEIVVADEVWQAVLMEFEPGHHPRFYDEKLLAGMARMQAYMHTLGVEFATTVSSKPEPLVALTSGHMADASMRLTLADPELVALCERGMRLRVRLDKSLPLGYSHFDFDRGNLLVTEDNEIAAVLDFDDTKYAPVVICLANTLWNILANSADYEMSRRYLESYGRIRPLSLPEEQVLGTLVLYRHYQICGMEMMFGRVSSEDAQAYLSLERRIKELPVL